jgi:hypothetical protein
MFAGGPEARSATVREAEESASAICSEAAKAKARLNLQTKFMDDDVTQLFRKK